MSSEPVFFDPEGTRRKRVNFWVASLSLILAILTTIVIFSFFAIPLLPKIRGFSDTQHRSSSLIPTLPSADKRAATYLSSQARHKLDKAIAKDKKEEEAEKAKAIKVPAGSAIVAAFYTPGQGVGISSFRQNAKGITHVLPTWLALDPADPSRLSLTNYDVPTTEEGLKQAGQQLVDIARTAGVRIWPVLQNYDRNRWDRVAVSSLLDSPDKQAALANNLKDWLKTNGYDGLNVDFESLGSADYGRLPQFLALLRKTLHAASLGLSIDLEADDDGSTIKSLAEYVDLVIVMAYDDHSQDGDPGPIAPVDWTETILEKYADAVPQNKLVIGIGSYAYDWSKGQRTTEYTYQGALKTAQGYLDDQTAADVLDLDETSLNTHFDYEDDDNKTHQVWVLDGVSAFNQWKLAQEIGVRGAALWQLGTEDPSIWQFLSKDKVGQVPDPGSLKTVEFGPDELETIGEGDLLYAKGDPQTATRQIVTDPDNGLVVDQTYDGYPSSYYIQKSGISDPKTVALTFDDGPDPTNTPAILDVLKQFKVPATFFVIGQNAESARNLVRRAYDEGHEIGNHTFTHPNLDETSADRTEAELDSCQLAIEGITGRKTALFRPPYNADSNPSTLADVEAILLASKLGYVTVGESIDPQDWRLHENGDDTGALRTPQEMVDAVLYQISLKQGNVILLHDGGGDRTATIEALKLLIPALQSKGYKFVPVSALMKTTRDGVMPPIAAQDRTLVGLDQFAFSSLFTFEWLLRLAFLTAIGLGLLRVAFNLPLAMLHNRRKIPVDPVFKPAVSVLIAAFNEERVITRTVSSILASEYPVSEILVVDDGSADTTFLEVATQFAGDSRVVALQQPNGGKASALNRALSQAKGEIVVCIDADTQLMPTAIALLVRHFSDKRIGAVAGNVKVGNRLNILTRWQSVEYITSQNLDRRAYAMLDAISVCPGAIGAWRKSSLVEVGGYLSDTLAEDMDLTWRLQRAGWKIETESGAVAYTEAPDTFRGFFNQRFRWAYGTLQCLWKHRKALFRNGWFGWLTLPTLWLFQIVFNVLAPLVDLQLLYTGIIFFTAWVSKSEYTKDWRPVSDAQQTLVSVAFLYGLFFTVELVSGFIAYRTDREKPRELWWLFLQRFVYRQIMYAVVFKSILTAIRGRRQGWGKLERKATVEIEGK